MPRHSVPAIILCGVAAIVAAIVAALIVRVVGAVPPGGNAPTSTVQPPTVEVFDLLSLNRDDPNEYLFAGAMIPVTDANESKSHRGPYTLLGAALPIPNQDWHLAEVSTAPAYIVVRHVKTGQRAVIWKGKPPANPPALKPIPLPVPPPPGIGCIFVSSAPGTNLPPSSDKRMYALLTGGAYTGDSILGYYREGQRLPKPWDKWRVAEAREDFMNGSWSSGWCVIRNDDTGESVRLRVKQWIDLPHDAPIPATQPADGQ